MPLKTTTPSILTAGMTAEWLITLEQWPSPSWTLTYALVSSANTITIPGQQYGDTDAHHIVVSAASAQDWSPGRYSFQAAVTNGTEKHLVEYGTIDVRPDFAAQSDGYDDRSWNKRCLDNIEAVIEGRATKAQSEYAIAGRQLKFVPLIELMDMRDRFRSAYLAEERKKVAMKSGTSILGKIPVRFN